MTTTVFANGTTIQPTWLNDVNDVVYNGAVFTQTGTGAVASKVDTKLKEFSVNLLDFIPVSEHAAIINGTSTYDCRAGFQAAIDSLGGMGGRLKLPRGTIPVTDSGGQCISITCPIILEGEGAYTWIKPKSTVSGTSSIIHVQPGGATPGAYIQAMSEYKNFGIGDPSVGTRYGGVGILLDTQIANAQLPSLTISRLYITQSTTAGTNGSAIYHINTQANNANGGLYGSTIEKCALNGGIFLDGSGDSIYIEKNIISDLAGYHHCGITANITFDPGTPVNGASQLHIIENNITTNGGAIDIQSGRRVHIKRNNLEMVSGQTISGNSSSMINLSGSSHAVCQPVIEGNNITSNTGSGVVYGIYFQTGEGGRISENSFLPSSNTEYAIQINAGWSHLAVGKNQFGSGYGGTGNARRVSDSGVGTMGVVRAIPLNTTYWNVYNASFASPYYIKDEEGYVTIQGLVTYTDALATGVAPAGVALQIGDHIGGWDLPVDYRPTKSEYFQVFSQTSVPVVTQGAILISAGAGTIVWVAGGTTNDIGIQSIACRFLAAKPAGTNIIMPNSGAGSGYGSGYVSDN